MLDQHVITRIDKVEHVAWMTLKSAREEELPIQQNDGPNDSGHQGHY